MNNDVINVNGREIPLNEVEIPLSNGGTEIQKEAQFFSKIISVSGTPQPNSNGTEFRIATIQFVDANGEQVTHTAMMWEKSFAQYQEGLASGTINEGESHLTTLRVSQSRPNPSIVVSHLTTASQASLSTFGLEGVTFGKVDQVQEVEDLEEIEA